MTPTHPKDFPYFFMAGPIYLSRSGQATGNMSDRIHLALCEIILDPAPKKQKKNMALYAVN